MVPCRTTSGRGLALLAVFVALLFVPAADAQTVLFDTVDVRMGPSAFDADLQNQSVEAGNAVSLRAYIDDSFGEAADGIVTPDEYEAYRGAEIQRFNEQLDNPIATGLFADLQVNGGRARGIQVTDVSLSSNVMGSTADNDTIYRGVSARLTFAPTEMSRVNVAFGQDFRVPFRLIEMEWTAAFFAGAGVWRVDPATTDPKAVADTFWQQDRFVVPYDQSGEFSSKDAPLAFEIYDSSAEKPTAPKGSKKGSPGLGAEFALAGLVGLAALLRRKA